MPTLHFPEWQDSATSHFTMKYIKDILRGITRKEKHIAPRGRDGFVGSKFPPLRQRANLMPFMTWR